MKIVVDGIPEKPEDCYFAEYSGSGFYDCVLDHAGCSLCYPGNRCDKLIQSFELCLVRPMEEN